MVKVIFIICIMFAGVDAQTYKHKTEAQIAAMTPEQRVDEWVNEYVNHRIRFDDDQRFVIRFALEKDGLKALPRLIQIMDEYDPTKSSGRNKNKRERFEASFQMLGYIDAFALRLKGSEDGRRAIASLENALKRLNHAGHRTTDDDQVRYRFELVEYHLNDIKGFNTTDRGIRDTLRVNYKVAMSDKEFEEFIEYLVKNQVSYPGWSRSTLGRDPSLVNAAGNPLVIRLMDHPERYHEAYKEFKNNKRTGVDPAISQF